jgi:hypothetical protein
MPVEGPSLAAWVQRQVAELTTVTGPAPAVHRQTLAVARSEAAAAPGSGSGGGGDESKGAFDADGFLRQLVRQVLHDEGLHRARDLTPWD